MRRKITNPELVETIRFLKTQARQTKSEVWHVAAEQLSSPRSRRAELDLNHISRASAPNAVVLVPGKVLADGALKHPVVVGAFRFSATAKVKIEKEGGKCLTIQDLVGRYPNGSKVQILR
jgi:ribosomal protein L18E